MSFAVANRFRMDNAGLQVGIRAGNDAISRLQIEDGSASNISQLLDRGLGRGRKEGGPGGPNDFARRARCQHRAIPIAPVAAGRKK